MCEIVASRVDLILVDTGGEGCLDACTSTPVPSFLYY